MYTFALKMFLFICRLCCEGVPAFPPLSCFRLQFFLLESFSRLSTTQSFLSKYHIDLLLLLFLLLHLLLQQLQSLLLIPSTGSKRKKKPSPQSQHRRSLQATLAWQTAASLTSQHTWLNQSNYPPRAQLVNKVPLMEQVSVEGRLSKNTTGWFIRSDVKVNAGPYSVTESEVTLDLYLSAIS